MARKGFNKNQPRDASGRFASAGGGGSGGKGKGKGGASSKAKPKPAAKPKATAKPKTPAKPKAPARTTTARGRARTAETRARAAVKAGGGRKAARSLATAQRARDWYKATNTGTKRSKVRTRVGPANAVKPFKRQPPRNNIRRLKSVTPDGAFDRTDRKVNRSLREMSDVVKSMGEGKARRSDLRKRFKKMRLDNIRSTARMQAQAIADRLKGGIDAEIASITLGSLGGRLGRQQIQRRARRAALKASRGSKPAAKAVQLYDRQLAAMGPGKPSRKAKSNIVPGPRNTNQPPKKPKRKRKK